MIRVWIDADSPVIRAGLASLLRSDAQIELVAEEGHAEVVLTDSYDPESLHNQTVVALSDAPSQALRAGASTRIWRIGSSPLGRVCRNGCTT